MNIKKNYYDGWLNYDRLSEEYINEYINLFENVYLEVEKDLVLESIKEEMEYGIKSLLNKKINFNSELKDASICIIDSDNTLLDEVSIFDNSTKEEAYLIKNVTNNNQDRIIITSKSSEGKLFGVFKFLQEIKMKTDLRTINIFTSPANNIRMLNHWDNLDGSIERGYAGRSIFYKDNDLRENLERIKDYARMLVSIGINAVSINNVNVSEEETKLIDEKIDIVTKINAIFKQYGIKTYLSINYASPIQLSGFNTADPLDKEVRNWWRNKVEEIYNKIPDFGGFVVKADSEGRPGPFTYGRSHAQGANMLAEALKPYGGFLIWRCFVYNCEQDWRDYETDRARAAYDNFKPLDGKFADNVILQIKNGPMDFQVREPVSPLFGAMPETNQMLELQITQEYTGQQKDLCYLLPQWKEVIDFDTYARGEGSAVKRILDGSLFNQQNTGFAAVVNVGDDENWTGHFLALANLYAYGRLAWNPDLKTKEITEEWIKSTFGNNKLVIDILKKMLLNSWEIYENYTSPLGIGWMVSPGHHYGPDINGYEYSKWGTYHRADHFGIGVDRTAKTGTGYTNQYFKENARRYESLTECPDELLLFFHHVPYTHKLDSGKTLIQHIYDTHFKGVEQVKELQDLWSKLKKNVNEKIYVNVKERLEMQLDNAVEWRDRINTYFYRMSTIDDKYDRKIY